MKNRIAIKHGFFGLSVGGTYYAVHEGPRSTQVAYLNDQQLIESACVALFNGSHGAAKHAVETAAQKAAAQLSESRPSA